MQRALLQYYNPANKDVIIKALKKAGRYDLIGVADKCLVKGEDAGKKSSYGKSKPANYKRNVGNNYGKKKK